MTIERGKLNLKGVVLQLAENVGLNLEDLFKKALENKNYSTRIHLKIKHLSNLIQKTVEQDFTNNSPLAFGNHSYYLVDTTYGKEKIRNNRCSSKTRR